MKNNSLKDFFEVILIIKVLFRKLLKLPYRKFSVSSLAYGRDKPQFRFDIVKNFRKK